MGTALSGKGEKTLILDLSYQGQSVYDLFGMKITSPISQKQQDSSSFEQMLPERIVKIDDNLHLFNISFGSKVKVAPEIISPILFFLSKEYRYIICDCSDVDVDLRDSVFGSSDIIFSLTESGRKQEKAFRVFDRSLNDGQRVYYVHNEYTMGSVKNVTGSLLLEEVPAVKNEPVYPRLMEFCGRDGFRIFEDIVTSGKKALVLESNMLESVLFYGILKSLDEAGKTYDVIYTSSFSFIVTALYMTSNGPAEFRKNMQSFFTAEKLNSFLDITFPEKYVFKNSSIARVASDFAGRSRLEMFRTVPMPLLAGSEGGSRRIFSTGSLKECMEASFSLYPLFESGTVGGSEYCSGYPLYRVRAEDLFRTDVDSISYVSVNNHDRLRIKSDRVLSFYRKYIEFIEEERYDEKKSNAADNSFVIELNESSFKLDRLLEQSEKMAVEIVKNIP